MNDYCIEILKNVYEHCLDGFTSRSEQSLFIQIISSNKNTVKRAITAAAVNISESASAIGMLRDEGYLKEVSPNQYAITARGIFFIESQVLSIENSYYAEWVDERYLQMDNEPITDKNRVILLAVFSARCFSEETCAIYSDSSSEKAFYQLLIDCGTFLSSLGVVKDNSVESSFKSKSKSKIAAFMNQIDRLPSSTGMKFISKDKSYYLDVIKDGSIDRQAITFLTKIILGGNLTMDTIIKLSDFCNTQYMKCGYIFSANGVTYDDALSSFQLKNGMDDAII